MGWDERLCCKSRGLTVAGSGTLISRTKITRIGHVETHTQGAARFGSTCFIPESLVQEGGSGSGTGKGKGYGGRASGQYGKGHGRGHGTNLERCTSNLVPLRRIYT